MHKKPCSLVIIFYLLYIVKYILTEGGVPMTGFGLFIRVYMLVNITVSIAVIGESCKHDVDPEDFLISLLKELVEFFGFH